MDIKIELLDNNETVIYTEVLENTTVTEADERAYNLAKAKGATFYKTYNL